jgi:hypothetical protein
MNSEGRCPDKNSLIQPRRYQKGCGCFAALGLLILLYYGSYFVLNGQPAA